MVRANIFNEQIDWTRHCVASLKSCKSHEVENETRILKMAIDDMNAMALVKKNDQLEKRRYDMAEYAWSIIAERSN